MLRAVVVALAMAQVNAMSSLPALLKRQFDPSSVPAACVGSCVSLSDLSMCETTECFCSAQYITVITTCIDCVIAEGGDQTAGQSVLDEYVAACDGMGTTLASLIATSSVPSDTATTLTIPTDSTGDGSIPTPTSVTDSSTVIVTSITVTDPNSSTIPLPTISSPSTVGTSPSPTQTSGAEKSRAVLIIPGLLGLAGAMLVL